ncbi:glycerophosphodiester phosphodiesterase family protein [Bacteroides sedimenti]
MKRILVLICLMKFLTISIANAQPKVVAHRGYWDIEGSAQNSIRALIKADSIKCDACEFDVWMTVDKKLVVNHDNKINGYEIETTSSDTILNQKLKNGEFLPSLNQFLDVAKHLKIDLVLEVKPHKDKIHETEAVKMILDMVKEKGLKKRTSYITFSRNAFDELVKQTKRPILYLNGVAPDVLKSIGGTGADYHIDVFKKNPEWIKQLHDSGLEVNVWTVSDPEGIQWCIDNEADYITTNNPELVQKMIKSRPQNNIK